MIFPPERDSGQRVIHLSAVASNYKILLDTTSLWLHTAGQVDVMVCHYSISQSALDLRIQNTNGDDGFFLFCEGCERVRFAPRSFTRALKLERVEEFVTEGYAVPFRVSAHDIGVEVLCANLAVMWFGQESQPE